MGLERLHTASTTAGESEKPDFSFFFVVLISIFLITVGGGYNLEDRKSGIS